MLTNIFCLLILYMVYNDYVRAYIALLKASKQYLYTASIYEYLRIITN